MALDSLADFLEEELKDLYNAENQLLKALPKMAKRAAADQLREAFTKHLEETREHVERLNTIGEELDIKLTGKKCKAMEGLVEEGKDIIDEDGDESVIDVALIGAAQRVEHYEIAAYGTVRSIAEELGYSNVAKILQKTLDEETATDEKLTELAEGGLNAKALTASEED